MTTKVLVLAGMGFLAGCQDIPKEAAPLKQPVLEAPVAPVSTTDMDQHNTEKVRLSESLKAYPVGRYVDPSDSNVMHEAHTIYRREAGSNWNLNPNAPTVIPLGPVMAIADPARSPNPLPAELEQKIAEQNQLMATLIEQNEALAAELTKLNKKVVELRDQRSPAREEAKK